MDRAPKVFISYSWKSEEYKEGVLRLAERLRGDGVDVILDRWHLRHGYDMYAFMEGGIREADKVLILCEQSYVEKANKRESGAGTETRIISPALYPESRQDKFIPVFMESHRIVPDYLRGRIGIPFQQQSDAQYEEMLRVIFDVPEVEIPQLGQPPAWLRKKNTSSAQRQPAPAPSAEKPPVPEVELPPPLPDEDKEDDELPPQIPPVKTDVPYIPASQQTEKPVRTPGPEYDYEITPEGASITKYKGRGGKVEIPGEIGGQPVVKIAKGAFDYCETLHGVTIPDSVTAIGTRAFNHCTGLLSVMLPASLTRIGNSAFCECSGLKYIEIPGRVESIGQFAFDKCSSLEALTLPASVRHIYSQAFSGTTLKTVYYDGSKSQWASIVIEKGNEALTHAKREYDIIEQFSPDEDFAYETSADGITIIGYIGAGGKVVIPDEVGGMAVTAIGRNAFVYCNALTSVSIPGSVTSIGDGAFIGCVGLTSVSIPNSVTSIGAWAFRGCTGLTSVSIPDSVTSIGTGAFYGCAGLTSVLIPDSVTSIGTGAFWGCISLPAIDVHSTNPSFTAVDGVLYSRDMKTLLAYPAGRKAATFTIPDSVTSIGVCAFDGCTGLTSVSIPDSVTSIGDAAFFGCKNLKDVYYTGSERQWNVIKIGSGNDPLKNATIHFAREDKPRRRL